MLGIMSWRVGLGLVLASVLAMVLTGCTQGEDVVQARDASRDQVVVLRPSNNLPRAVTTYISCLRNSGLTVVFPSDITLSGDLDKARVAPDSSSLSELLFWRHGDPTKTARRIARSCE